MKTPSHIYISGPMRGHDGSNFPAFFEAEEAIRTLYPEADICNPAREDVVRFNLHHYLQEDPSGLLAGRYLTDATEFGETELRMVMGADLAYITQHADLLVLLPGWQGSKGALAEKAAAESVGCAVIEARHPHVTPPVDPYTEGIEADISDLREMLDAHGEVRATSATGGQKGVKLAAFDQVSPEVETLVAEHFGKGARKYDAHNFRKGYPWSMSYSALRRHLAAFWAGEEYDNHLPTCPEGCNDHTGSLHIVAVIWHAMVLTEFFLHHKEYDDRYVYDQEA